MSEHQPPGSEAPAVVKASGAAIARSAFHLLLGQVATTALAIFFSAALGRRLGAADFGVFYLVTTSSTFAFVVVEWGQAQYVVREAARFPGKAGALLGSTLALRALATVPVSVAAVLMGWLLGYDGRTMGLLALMMVATLPFFLSQAYANLFRSRERMDLDALVSVVFKAASLGLALLALALGGGVAEVIAAQGLAGLVALGLAVWRSRGLGLPRTVVVRETCRELLAGGVAILAINLAVSVQPYLDAILVSKLLPREPVGWYGAARMIMGTLVAPATILGAAAYPRLSRAAGHAAEFRAELRLALRPLLGLGALGAVGTYLFADVAVGLIYGHRGFGPAADILRVFSAALFLVCIDVLFMNAVMAVGRSKALAAAKAINVVVCTGLGLLLIPLFQRRAGNGGMGLVAAFGLSEGIMFAASVWLLPRGTLGLGFLVEIGRAVAAAAVTLGVFALLPPLSPLLGIPLCILVFAAAAAAIGLVRREELRALSAMARRRAGLGAAEPPASP
jgi:O-antigen/teichoic acid export membrane protein